jgi:predicted RND superfamily exporter protein
MRTSPPRVISPTVAERVLAAGAASEGQNGERALLVAALEAPLNERRVRDRAVEGMRGALSGVPGATLTGMSAVAYDLEQATRADLRRSAVISLTLVVSWLMLVFRRPGDVALALIPLFFAIVLTLGVVAWGGLRINAINGVALPLLHGIAVDAGVFLVAAARMRRHGREGLRSTVQAVLAASTTTIAGFSALCVTSTPAIRSLGMLASVGVIGSLCGAVLLLLPVLLLRSAPPRTDES